MSGEVTVTAINGNFRKVYDSKVRDLRPRSAVLMKMLDFNTEKKVGESYNVSVVLQPPNGFTYAGSSGAVIALKQARNMLQKQASLVPYELDLREQVAYAVFSRAVADNGASFGPATEEIVSGMMLASSNRVEASMLHGQRGYGTIDTAGVTDLGSNTCTILISAATFAPGFWWAVGPGATFDSFTSTTKNNSTGPLILVSVAASTRLLTMTYSGTIASEAAAGDVLYPEGAWDGTTYTDMPGLLAQAGNTSGTSLGLSATTYPNWAGNTYSVGGPISHFILEDALSSLRDRGITGRIVCLLPNKAFSVICMELAQLRMIDSSYSKQKNSNGAEGVSYFSAEVGEVEMVPHPFMKLGEFLLLPINDSGVSQRIGSSDITFQLPGRKDEFTRFLDGYNAFELQNFSDQAVICKRPNHAMLGTGITYPT